MLKTLTGLIAGIGAAALMSGTALAQQGVTDDEIILGSHTALSGQVAVWGAPSTTAAKIYFERVNAEGGIHGRKIKFIVEDHQYQVPRAVQAGNKLINRDKIFAMVMALGTPHNNAVLSRQLAKNVPNLHPYTGARSMVEPVHPLKFNVVGNYYEQAVAATKHLVKDKGAKTVCTAYQDSDFGQEILDGTEDALKELGMDLAVKVPHKPSETDFVASVTALKNAGCDLVTMGTIVGDTIALYATAQALQLDATFVCSTACYDDVLALLAKGKINGIYAASNHVLVDTSQATGEAKEYFDAYLEATGKPATGAAQIGFVVASLVVEALRNAGPDLTVEKFVKAHEEITNFENMVSGQMISFSPTDHASSNILNLSQVVDGKWQLLKSGI